MNPEMSSEMPEVIKRKFKANIAKLRLSCIENNLMHLEDELVAMYSLAFEDAPELMSAENAKLRKKLERAIKQRNEWITLVGFECPDSTIEEENKELEGE